MVLSYRFRLQGIQIPFKLAPVGKQRMSVRWCKAEYAPPLCRTPHRKLRPIITSLSELRLRVSGFHPSGHRPPSRTRRRPCGRSPVAMCVSMYPVGPADTPSFGSRASESHATPPMRAVPSRGVRLDISRRPSRRVDSAVAGVGLTILTIRPGRA